MQSTVQLLHRSGPKLRGWKRVGRFGVEERGSPRGAGEGGLSIHPSLEGRCTPWVNAQESRQHPVLFVTNADKMVLAFQNLVGRFLRYRVHFGLFIALKEFRLI